MPLSSPDIPERLFSFADFPDRPIPLHAMIVNCGIEHVTSHDYRWDGMKRGSRELVIWQYTSGGMGELAFGGSRYELHDGEAMLLIVPEQHCYSLPANSDHWNISFVSLNAGRSSAWPGNAEDGITGRYSAISKIQKFCRQLKKYSMNAGKWMSSGHQLWLTDL